MFRRVGLLAVLLLLASPLAARAATIGVVYRDATQTVPGGGPHEGPTQENPALVATVILIGGPEPDDVTLASGSTGLDVTDAGATITPGGACAAVDAHTVHCTPFAGVTPGDRVALVAFAADLGAGNDVLRPAQMSLFSLDVAGGEGNDVLTATNFAGYVNSTQLEGGAGNDTLDFAGLGRASGGAGDDVIRGVTGTLDGGPGQDRVAGDNGATIMGGLGDDVLDGGGGLARFSYADRTAPVTVDLTAGTGGETGEHDTLVNFTSSGIPRYTTRVEGGHGNDTLIGTPGSDSLYGNGGDDHMVGGEGNDWLGGGPGGDRVEGGPGDDTVSGNEGTDHLDGGEGGDSLSDDSPEADVLAGGPGRDFIRAGVGADVIDAGPGPDQLMPAATRFRTLASVSCGTGPDEIMGVDGAGLVPPSCERISVSFTSVAARPLLTRAGPALRVANFCTSTSSVCPVRLTLRIGRCALGSGRVTLRGAGRPRILVRLGAAGAARLRRAKELRLSLSYGSARAIEWRVAGPGV